MSRRPLYIALAVGTAVVALIVACVADKQGEQKPPPGVIDLPGAAPVQTDPDNEQERDEQREASQRQPGSPDIHEDARDETPAGVSRVKAREGQRDTDAQGKRAPQPVGGAQNYRCRQQFVRNRSARSQPVLIFVLHYTVSAPGSLDAIQRLFNSPSFGASSHLGLELSGHCEQWVPFSQKAWTQGNFNGRAESVEIIARGTESRAVWLRSPIIRKGILASIVRDRLRARGLPLRLVDPAGCDVQRSGFTDHNRLECGNTHHDVAPNFPMDVFRRQVARGVGLTCTQKVQRALNRKLRPSPRLDVDGIRGLKTAAAVRRFQRQAKVRGKNATRRALGVRC